MLADMHMHTEFSLDSCAKMSAMADCAISKGIKTICFTDHIDWDFPEKNMVFDFDVNAYNRAIRDVKEKYKGKLEILMGVELGLQPHLASRYSDFLKSYPFDFVIGSVHLVNNRDPFFPEAFSGMTDQEAYRVYFENVLNNVQAFQEFDSLGHLDYIVRYGKTKAKEYRCADYLDVIDEILKMLIEHEKALEVNSAGFRKNLGVPNPHTDIIKRFKELGGERVTVGADAHKPAHIGYDFRRTAQLLKNCGFTYYTKYVNRIPHFVKI